VQEKKITKREGSRMGVADSANRVHPKTFKYVAKDFWAGRNREQSPEGEQ